MPDIRFGGPLGEHLVKGKKTSIRGFGMLAVSAEDDAVGAHATQVLASLVGRAGFDLAKALEDSSALQGELEARLAKDVGGRLTVQVKMLMLNAQ